MISAASLYNGVHDWGSTDRIRMCGISEERKASGTEDDTQKSISQFTKSKECCGNGSLTKVELKQMKDADKDDLQNEEGSSTEKREAQMPDSQTLDSAEEEVRPPAGTKVQVVNAGSSSRMQQPSSPGVVEKQSNNIEPSLTVQTKVPTQDNMSEASSVQDKPLVLEQSDPPKLIPNLGAQFIRPTWQSQNLGGAHPGNYSSFHALSTLSVNRVCLPSPETQTQQKLSIPFQHGTVLAQGQRFVYVPPSNYGQTLNMTSLPTTLGAPPPPQALPVFPSFLQQKPLQGTGINLTPELHSPFHQPSHSRTLSSEPKGITLEKKHTTSLSPSQLPSGSKNSKSTQSRSSYAKVSSPAVLPIKPSSSHSLLLSPHGGTGSTPVTSQYSRLPGHLEQNLVHQPAEKSSILLSHLKSPQQIEKQLICPQESGDMPLDLSSKSNRSKSVSNQRKTPPMPVLTPMQTSGKMSYSKVQSKTERSPQRLPQSSYANSTDTGTLSATPPYMIFPDLLKNGAALQKKALDPTASPLLGRSGSWMKHSTSLLNTIPGTYVGVANPVPASMLLRDDGAGEVFGDGYQVIAKQEPISIIDQGEQKIVSSSDTKICQMTKEDHSPPIRNMNSSFPSGSIMCYPEEPLTVNTSSAGSVRSAHTITNGKLVGSAVLPTDWSSFHQAALMSVGCSAIGRAKPHSRTPHKVPSSMGEYTLFPNPPPISTFMPAHRPVRENTLEEQRWKMGSPLSNLESIAKGRAFEMLVHTGKNAVNPSPSQEVTEVPGMTSGKTSAMDLRCLVGVETQDGGENHELIKPVSEKDWVHHKEADDERTLSDEQLWSCAGMKDQSTIKLAETELADSVSQDQFLINLRNIKKEPVGDDTPEIQEAELERVKTEQVDCDMTTSSPDSKSVETTSAALKGHCGVAEKSKNRSEETKEKTGKSKPVGRPKGHISKKQADQLPGFVRKNLKCIKKEIIEPPCRPGQGHQMRKKRRRSSALEGTGKEGKEGTSDTEGVMRKRRRRKTEVEGTDQKLEQEAGSYSCHFRRSAGDQSAAVKRSLLSQADGEEDEGRAETMPKTRRGRKTSIHRGLKEESPLGKTPDCSLSKRPRRTRRGVHALSGTALSTGKHLEANSDHDGDEDGDKVGRRKRRRRKNRKYQNGEYVTERDHKEEGEEEDSLTYSRQAASADLETRSACLRRRNLESRRYSETRINSNMCSTPKLVWDNRDGNKKTPVGSLMDSSNQLQVEKPGGKRKCKTKHIVTTPEKDNKVKLRRRSSLNSYDSELSSPSPKKSREHRSSYHSKRTPRMQSPPTALGSPSARPIPPEARRLIVNKNAGETLLQRAARLGYKDVVIYCLEKELSDINHRDNAGYTALHETCARGWIDIVKLLLEHGADVNCSAQDGTRPIHDAVVNDNVNIVWTLLSYGADPTLATYSGQTALKLACSEPMTEFLTDYFADMEGRSEGDPKLPWDFFSSSLLEGEEEADCDILANPPEPTDEQEEADSPFLFEFSDKPLLPCYNIQVSFSRGPCNWLLLSEVLKKLKLSARIFQARFPHFEVVSIAETEFHKQVSTSQLLHQPEDLHLSNPKSCNSVELIRYVPELLHLLGSTVEFLTGTELAKKS
ncbi:BCL-6 corepressor-like protein 1 [Latimeria chalumnae]|uniref:BCL-6 corepressor-like protein 1 n=1 Tax=Latimeria chalumnae TaxID=7897 RepID=UPI0003C120CE|nr:PREDICTED: BCL-6 corepressor-like protein 1 [Latimeria chalumnae]XP_005992041.1 PREDICTED: BCL-6 corepressor-like protein 1 [Latimeria chalumnae]XP_005992042.1 PREDICTED: BCL-6 corepressor-like protein 1 [Latimeria chalumnae]XP_005992043.1 PREDICTED: BCL-6 corepressor-like protein 1 [Latimeria chalumnae]XP_005992044.1 PREDICTED: BCL-6 corepressor-like protein 1 [Latimeria chalumnae]XP_014341588.1 PREDICTED: BCL-6 corepressor-like protein 1 [Latimeria chalumnae]|eukprot:XP_005992040.1 PREDICTED: BCL-6 corepressor-like protein 1 [Latimeria chalumnae]